MRQPVKNTLTVFVLFIIAAVLLPAGCGGVKEKMAADIRHPGPGYGPGRRSDGAP